VERKKFVLGLKKITKKIYGGKLGAKIVRDK